MAFDPNSTTDLTALRDELATDPEGLGYTGSDSRDSEVLNDDSLGATIRRRSVPADEIKASVDQTEFSGLSPKNTDYVTWVAQGDVRLSDAVVDGLLGAFPDGGPTETALQAAFSRAASRMEELFGPGSRCTPSDVANARRV